MTDGRPDAFEIDTTTESRTTIVLSCNYGVSNSVVIPQSIGKVVTPSIVFEVNKLCQLDSTMLSLSEDWISSFEVIVDQSIIGHVLELG